MGVYLETDFLSDPLHYHSIVTVYKIMKYAVTDLWGDLRNVAAFDHELLRLQKGLGRPSSKY